MAYCVQVKVLDGKQDTVDETRIDYRVGIPNDILFFFKDGIQYASWWDKNYLLIQVPVSQIVSID